MSLPPGPKGKPILGSISEFAADTLSFLTDTTNTYGDVVYFKLGHLPTYLVTDPVLVKEILLTQHTKFIKNSFFWRHFRGIFGKGLLTNEGQPWRVQRKLAAPAFQHKRIATYVDYMVQFTRETQQQWQDGATLDIHDEMMRLTADIVAKALFDASMATDGQALLDAVHVIEAQIPIRMARPFVFLDYLPLKSNRAYQKALQTIEQEINRFIQHHRDQPGQRETLLSMLMEACYEDGSAMSDKQLRDEVITLFLAGHDTTAITLSWTLYLLSQHPECKARVQHELETVLQGNAPTMSDLADLHYLRNVIKESMRLFPAAFVFGRESVEDVQLGPWKIPKGTTVLVSPWVSHRSEKYFANAQSFEPDRWTEDFEKNQLPRYVYMPFGGGPRVCIGEGFAMMEAQTLLAILLQSFEFEYAGDEKPKPFASITLSPAAGMKMRLRVRASRDSKKEESALRPAAQY
ncbi:MAG: cytochrome P450 [Pseudomonadales bacterium]|uniref:Cytochrome P450 n=1 Tax=Oleiphilus messinensis TaxID=141451 RepID=A0A1Y0IFZ0_9GAMM|nr:cytochrome P450 [Oleiphilus messinensis]ARU59150.1 cytochrome P450 [Oleiphilus messinensis]MCG8612565.1 cytochrome P450 [Pseudomonadales bacterium]